MEERILNMGYCEICGKYGITERHHVFYGTANRKQSEKYGIVCELCAECHRGKQGVHRNRNIDMELKRKRDIICKNRTGLLIVPYGIETSMQDKAAATECTFNH